MSVVDKHMRGYSAKLCQYGQRRLNWTGNRDVKVQLTARKGIYIYIPHICTFRSLAWFLIDKLLENEILGACPEGNLLRSCPLEHQKTTFCRILQVTH